MASKRQRKKRAKQRRQERAAAERAQKLDIKKQERTRKYQQKHADNQKSVAISQPTEKKRKSAKKTSNREWLEQAFIQRVDDANVYLKEFEENETIQLLQDDYGGILADDELMTAKGRFRKNPSKLSNKQLEQRISLLDSFLSDAPEYRKDKEKIDKVAEKLGLNDPAFLQSFGDFMEFVRSILGDRVEPSDIIKDVAIARLNNGQSIDELKRAFMDSYLHNDNYWAMMDSFSEQGVYI